MTGLYCRRYFDARIAEEMERSRRFGTSFALIMLDLDDFKQLNDSLGHLAGDRALREVAAIAASQLRGVDLAARWGGEELAFLLPRTSLVDAHAVAERIREAVATHVIAERGQTRRITASLGSPGWAESGADERSIWWRAPTPRSTAPRPPARTASNRPGQLRAHPVARAGPPPPGLSAQVVSACNANRR